MSITSELRAWAKEHLGRNSILAIADRIDAEHESAVYNMRREFEEWEHTQDMCYVKLPVDADGVPIRVGDVMEFSAFEIEKPVTRMVDGIGQGVFFTWCGERGYQQHEAKRYRHHKQPTVEDVLREFANEVYADADNEIRDRDFLCAKYAKRLQLREVDE